MNKLILKSLGAVLLTGTLLCSVQAQTSSVTTTTDTTSMGTISEFNPQAILIKTETGTAPVRYVYGKTTTYVDETGKPVSMTTIKSGVPVTVHYTKSGEVMTASKVIVRKAVVAPGAAVEKTTTTIESN